MTNCNRGTSPQRLIPDDDQVLRHFTALSRPGEVREVRVLGYSTDGGRRTSTASGYFDNAEAVVKAIREIGSQRAHGIYITQNAVDPRLLARAKNRLEFRAKQTTSDADVLRYQHLTFDFDPKRPSGISSTDPERDQALTARDRFIELTQELGWPEPLAAMMSGNGGMVTFRIDVECDEPGRALIEAVLKTAEKLAGTSDVSVDTTLSNPSRIIKLCGTVAAKGDPTADRPHRRAMGDFSPTARVVSRSQLQEFFALAPGQESLQGRPTASPERGSSYDIAALLDARGIGYTIREKSFGRVFVLDRCLSSDDHRDGAAFFQFPSGAVSYRCHHNRCAGIGWQEAKTQLGIPSAPESWEGAETAMPLGKALNQGQVSPSPNVSLIMRRMDTVEPRAVEWLWPGWLPQGKLTVLGGHTGDGKSTLAAALAARLSRPGSVLPDGAPAPLVNSLFLLAEDALDDTLRPRLDAMGAEPSRIHAVEAVREANQERLFNLKRHLPLLEDEIRAHAIGLVVIDPVTSFMSGGDRNAEGEVRDALTPLAKMADRTGTAVFAIMHVGKPSGTQRRPVQLLLGATAFGAIARAVWMTTLDPDDPEGERRVLGVVKTNLAKMPPSLVWSRSLDGPILWHGQSAVPVGDLFAPGGISSISDAEAFLREELAAGVRLAAEVKAIAKEQDLTEKMLRTARQKLGVHVFRDPENPRGPWFWELPPEGSGHPPAAVSPDPPRAAASGASGASGASAPPGGVRKEDNASEAQMPLETSEAWASGGIGSRDGEDEVVVWSA